jgi:hypothetical protein
MNKEHHEQAQKRYEVVADGTVIYDGEDWARVFREAALNPVYGHIVLMIDGKSGAYWSPPQPSKLHFPG